MVAVCGAIALVVSGFVFARPAKKTPDEAKTPGETNVDMTAVRDSALILADDYAVALVEKPEFASARLNAFRRFHGRQPETVRDSVCGFIFDFMADYVEQGKQTRADAFSDLFLSVASQNDSRRGPMYAMRLAVARENFDTIALKENITLLDDYARRMEFDYDQDLDEAKSWLRWVRTRKPVRDAMVGVWVSEDVGGIVRNEEGRYYYHYPEKDYKLINSTKVLQIRNTDNPIYRNEIISGKYKGNDLYVSLDSVNSRHDGEKRNLDVIKCRGNLRDFSPMGGTSFYVPVEAWELPGYGMAPLDSSYLAETPIRGTLKFNKLKDHNVEHLSRITRTDDETYSMYVYWGDERLKRNNAEIGAIIRQTTQHLKASVAGELSRSRYSFADRLVGQVTSDIISVGINGILDAVMVSKDEIWGLEMMLHMENPYMLIADIYAEKVTAKSNSSEPEVLQYHHRANYYRWEPQDSVFFMGTYYSDYQPWNYKGGLITLHDMTKEDKKICKAKADEYKEKWKKWYKDGIKKLEENIKTLKRGSDERKQAEENLKNYKERQIPQIWIAWNRGMLEKLKAKSDSYRP